MTPEQRIEMRGMQRTEWWEPLLLQVAHEGDVMVGLDGTVTIKTECLARFAEICRDHEALYG